MRIGIMAGTTGTKAPEAFLAEARAAAEAGLETYWMPQVLGLDALGLLGWLGAEVPGILDVARNHHERRGAFV